MRVFGAGCSRELQRVLEHVGVCRPFVVTGRGSFLSSGGAARMDQALGAGRYVRFSEFSPNPKLDDLERGLGAFSQIDADGIIAIGGGSVIDMAKLIRFFSRSGLGPREYLSAEKASVPRLAPMVAIPTTAGSGSEATRFAVLYIDGVKHSLEVEELVPNAAIIDSDLMASAPRHVKAASGMDALAQAIESLWSVHSTDESKELAKRSVALTSNNIEAAVLEQSDSALLAMAEGANLAGAAINISKTTAAHAVSYPMTSHFGVAHGHAVALTLPAFVQFNAAVTNQDVLDSRGVSYVRETIREIAGLLGAATAREAGAALTRLMRSVGLATRLSALGIRVEQDSDLIMSYGFNPDRVKNNPRRLTEAALRQMLHSIG